jgi:hypothetical protein|tara:strand:+ start:559 stop:744 length:186 start_codon:yes stop_codon:yes gene_type:complete
MTKSKLIKNVSAYLEGRPQTVILNSNQLEQLRNLESDAFFIWDGIKIFNEEIGNTNGTIKK